MKGRYKMDNMGKGKWSKTSVLRRKFNDAGAKHISVLTTGYGYARYMDKIDDRVAALVKWYTDNGHPAITTPGTYHIGSLEGFPVKITVRRDKVGYPDGHTGHVTSYTTRVWIPEYFTHATGV
jgi:hypothetical protein